MDIGFLSETIQTFEFDLSQATNIYDFRTYEGRLSEMMFVLPKTKIIQQRSVYTYFDLLGDVGGLQGIIMQGAATLLYFLSFLYSMPVSSSVA